MLLNFMNTHFLNQHIMCPTRNRNVLDLVLSNNSSLIQEVEQEVNGFLTDHNTLKISTPLYPGLGRNKKEEQPTFYSSNLYKFNLNKATDGEWSKYRDTLTEKMSPMILNLKSTRTLG